MEQKKRIGEHLEKYIRWFSDLSNEDIAIAGGKGASLGEMYNSDFPIPPGFVITAQAFDYFIKQNELKDKIKSILETIDMENTEELEKRSVEIRKLVEAQEMPEDLKQEILESYHILSSEKINKIGVSENALNILKNSQEPIFVAVRSSATTEDLAEASFAGQQESFLNIKGDSNLIEFVKKCFSSLFTARAIYYRNKKGFNENPLLAVVVMKMIDSEKSGVIFSRNPVGSQEDIAIEAVYGLGEGIVSGKIKPDNYLVSRNLEIQSASIADKKIAIVRTASGRNEVFRLTPERSKSQVLTNGQIIESANYGIRLEEYYKKPQDIEFAIEANRFYIVQSRPITTLKKETKKTGTISGKIILEGLGSSPGIGVGTVRIVKDMSDLSKIKKGDILVTEMTNPDMVVSMQKSAAIVTNEGGTTSHASIVSREMGIPCVVGTGNATSVLKNGEKVTVDGTNGKIYQGEVAETHLEEVKTALKTEKIKIKLIVDLPDFAERASKSGIDAVGLLRIEGIIASSEKHPLFYEKENTFDEYTELLRNGIENITKYFNSAWIRTSDIRTDEYSSLKGAPEKELNPMLGLHGIRFSLKHPKIFESELLAIKKVAEKYPQKKFGVMFPQIISIEEVREAKEYFNKHKAPNMNFGVMIETPAAVQIIEDICREGIDFISFGTNDLTQFTLAVDRGEEDVQYLYSETHPAVFSQIRRVIGACKRNKVETSICGQAGSKKEMVEFLFKQEINSISVNADSSYETSKLIKELEEERMKEIKERKMKELEERRAKEAERNRMKEMEERRMREAEGRRIREMEERRKDVRVQPLQNFKSPWENKESQSQQSVGDSLSLQIGTDKNNRSKLRSMRPIWSNQKPVNKYQPTKYSDIEPVDIAEPMEMPPDINDYKETVIEDYGENEEPEEFSERLLNKNNIKIPAEMDGAEFSENEDEVVNLSEDSEIIKEHENDRYIPEPENLKGYKKLGIYNPSEPEEKNHYNYFDEDYK